MLIKIKTPFIFEKRRNTTPVAPIWHIHNILNSHFLTINTNTPQLLEKPCLGAPCSVESKNVLVEGRIRWFISEIIIIKNKKPEDHPQLESSKAQGLRSEPSFCEHSIQESQFNSTILLLFLTLLNMHKSLEHSCNRISQQAVIKKNRVRTAPLISCNYASVSRIQLEIMYSIYNFSLCKTEPQFKNKKSISGLNWTTTIQNCKIGDLKNLNGMVRLWSLHPVPQRGSRKKISLAWGLRICQFYVFRYKQTHKRTTFKAMSLKLLDFQVIQWLIKQSYDTFHFLWRPWS